MCNILTFKLLSLFHTFITLCFRWMTDHARCALDGDNWLRISILQFQMMFEDFPIGWSSQIGLVKKYFWHKFNKFRCLKVFLSKFRKFFIFRCKDFLEIKQNRRIHAVFPEKLLQAFFSPSQKSSHNNKRRKLMKNCRIKIP